MCWSDPQIARCFGAHALPIVFSDYTYFIIVSFNIYSSIRCEWVDGFNDRVGFAQAA